ncbi:hypothetical protein PPYR_06592 [Photinus pyralis]|uniref:C2H2-type domain-containing protein n=1 Tax=Photinus pyralis TaxID=7054 RepID=A0A1Y1L564_PHOPY|nr:hypothetical protein PPYR_06592 [Photinus pyralis]
MSTDNMDITREESGEVNLPGTVATTVIVAKHECDLALEDEFSLNDIPDPSTNIDCTSSTNNSTSTESATLPGGVGGFVHCHNCSYTTKWKKSLINHLKEYHGLEEFHCEQCKFVTRRKRVLFDHVKVRHQWKTFNCQLCNYRTQLQGFLLRHMKVCHSSHSS